MTYMLYLHNSPFVANRMRDMLLKYAFLIGGAIVAVVFVAMLVLVSQFDVASTTFADGILAGAILCCLSDTYTRILDRLL